MRRSSLTLFAIPLLVFDAWGVETEVTCPDEEAVRATVQTYFDGMMEGRPDKLRTVFHEEAFLLGVSADGSIVRVPVADWADGMDRPVSDARTYRNQIASVDVNGNAATVKTVLEWPRVTYIDYLSLLRVEGEWRIVNKVWDRSLPPSS